MQLRMRSIKQWPEFVGQKMSFPVQTRSPGAILRREGIFWCALDDFSMHPHSKLAAATDPMSFSRIAPQYFSATNRRFAIEETSS